MGLKRPDTIRRDTISTSESFVDQASAHVVARKRGRCLAIFVQLPRIERHFLLERGQQRTEDLRRVRNASP